MDASSEEEAALTQLGLVLREIAVKLSKEDAHAMLLILSSSIQDKEVTYEEKSYEAIPSEGKAIEKLFNSVYKLQHIYLMEKEAIREKHEKEASYLSKKIDMLSDEIKLNDKHMKALRPQDMQEVQDEIEKKVKRIETHKKQFEARKKQQQEEMDEIKKHFSNIIVQATAPIA